MHITTKVECMPWHLVKFWVHPRAKCPKHKTPPYHNVIHNLTVTPLYPKTSRLKIHLIQNTYKYIYSIHIYEYIHIYTSRFYKYVFNVVKHMQTHTCLYTYTVKERETWCRHSFIINTLCNCPLVNNNEEMTVKN